MRTKALEGAFLTTTYRVATDAGLFNLRIGVANAAFDDYLRRLGIFCWAVLTACNPRGVRDDDGNSQRQIELLERIKLLAYPYFQASNLADDDAWPAEPGFLLLQASTAMICALATEFFQLAFVCGNVGCAPRIFWLRS